MPKNRDRLDINIISPQPKESFFRIKSVKYFIETNKNKEIKKDKTPKLKVQL